MSRVNELFKILQNLNMALYADANWEKTWYHLLHFKLKCYV